MAKVPFDHTSPAKLRDRREDSLRNAWEALRRTNVELCAAAKLAFEDDPAGCVRYRNASKEIDRLERHIKSLEALLA